MLRGLEALQQILEEVEGQDQSQRKIVGSEKETRIP
jgi:hypothetical protein